MTTQAVLYNTHFASASVKREANKLVRELDPDIDIFAVGCCKERGVLDDLISERISVRAYVREDLRALPYSHQLAQVNWKTMRGNTDLAIMRFFRGNPDYDYYWIIEYDVRFTGHWETLFNILGESAADLLCTHLTSREQGPDWMHWDGFSAGDDRIAGGALMRGFLPFARVSNTMMRAIDERCSRGWTGHPEVLWPTIAMNTGGRVEEIGGRGPRVPDNRRGLFYHSFAPTAGLFLGTFGAWPYFSEKSNFYATSPSDLLWHPVKE